MLDPNDKRFDAPKAVFAEAQQLLTDARYKADLCPIIINGEGGIGVTVKGRFNEEKKPVLQIPEREPEQRQMLEDVKTLLEKDEAHPVRTVTFDLRFGGFRSFIRVPRA